MDSINDKEYIYNMIKNNKKVGGAASSTPSSTNIQTTNNNNIVNDISHFLKKNQYKI